jgi:hypothetical protein
VTIYTEATEKCPSLTSGSYASPSTYFFYSLVRWSVLVTCMLAVITFTAWTARMSGCDTLRLPPFFPLLYSPAIPLLGIRTIPTCFPLLSRRRGKRCEWRRLRCSGLPASVYYFIPLQSPPVSIAGSSKRSATYHGVITNSGL